VSIELNLGFSGNGGLVEVWLATSIVATPMVIS